MNHDMPLDSPPPCAEPHLGLATTEQLLRELECRMRIDIVCNGNLSDGAKWYLRDACVAALAALERPTLEYRTASGV